MEIKIYFKQTAGWCGAKVQTRWSIMHRSSSGCQYFLADGSAEILFRATYVFEYRMPKLSKMFQPFIQSAFGRLKKFFVNSEPGTGLIHTSPYPTIKRTTKHRCSCSCPFVIVTRNINKAHPTSNSQHPIRTYHKLAVLPGVWLPLSQLRRSLVVEEDIIVIDSSSRDGFGNLSSSVGHYSVCNNRT